MHWAGTTQTDAESAIAALAAGWAALDAQVSNLLTWSTESDVEQISAATGELLGVFQVDPVADAGTGTADPLPFATQGLIRWRTGSIVNGREVRGRTFIPAPTEAVAIDGRPSAAFVTAASAAIAAWTGGLVALEIWHRPNELGAGSAWSVETGQLWNQFAVLRSRRD
jgi:hypothetical protein